MPPCPFNFFSPLSWSVDRVSAKPRRSLASGLQPVVTDGLQHFDSYRCASSQQYLDPWHPSLGSPLELACGFRRSGSCRPAFPFSTTMAGYSQAVASQWHQVPGLDLRRFLPAEWCTWLLWPLEWRRTFPASCTSAPITCSSCQTVLASASRVHASGCQTGCSPPWHLAAVPQGLYSSAAIRALCVLALHSEPFILARVIQYLLLERTLKPLDSVSRSASSTSDVPPPCQPVLSPSRYHLLISIPLGSLGDGRISIHFSIFQLSPIPPLSTTPIISVDCANHYRLLARICFALFDSFHRRSSFVFPHSAPRTSCFSYASRLSLTSVSTLPHTASASASC